MKNLDNLPTSWGVNFKTGQVTFHLPEEHQTITIEEAIERAKKGDRQLAVDLVKAWHSISYPLDEPGGHTPVEMPPELNEFVLWFVQTEVALSQWEPRRSGQPRKGPREKWVEDRVIEGLYEKNFEKLSGPEFNFSSRERKKVAIAYVARDLKVTERRARRRLKRAEKSRSTLHLGFREIDPDKMPEWFSRIVERLVGQ